MRIGPRGSVQRQCHIACLDQTELSQDLVEDQREDGGRDKAEQKDADPHHGGMLGGGDDADGAYQTAGAHAGGYADALKTEYQRGDWTADGGGQGGR